MNNRRSLNNHAFDSKVGEWLKILGSMLLALVIAGIFAVSVYGGIYLFSNVVSRGWHNGK